MEENKVEDKTEKTFKERYLAGEIEFEEIDRYISRWNNSDDERTLAVYLRCSSGLGAVSKTRE